MIDNQIKACLKVLQEKYVEFRDESKNHATAPPAMRLAKLKPFNSAIREAVCTLIYFYQLKNHKEDQEEKLPRDHMYRQHHEQWKSNVRMLNHASDNNTAMNATMKRVFDYLENAEKTSAGLEF